MQKIFKSIWFKCITVLLAILLVSGGLLSILSDVLYVSAEERTNRAIKKLYDGEEKQFSTLLDEDKGDEVKVMSIDETEVGKIQKVYKVGDEEEFEYVFKSTGYMGYKNGTVTVWVKVAVKNNDKKITKVVLENYEKQTLMSKLDGNYYDGFLVDITDKLFTASNKDDNKNKNIVTGATKSATAGCNAVNAVILYINENGLGGETK